VAGLERRPPVRDRWSLKWSLTEASGDQVRRASAAPARSHQLFQGHVKDILSLFAKTVIKFDGTAIFRACRDDASFVAPHHFECLILAIRRAELVRARRNT
jgi:hypothetical protein